MIDIKFHQVLALVAYSQNQTLNLIREVIWFFCKENSVKNPRLGVSIKKRDYKLATQRNMLKRKVKNSFMGFIADLPSVDFVVLVGPGVQPNDKKTLSELWSNVEVK